MTPNTRHEIYQIELRRLADSPSQHRSTYNNLDELASSIRANGVLQPILCRPITHQQIGADPEQDLEIVAGHRRRRATEMAGLDEIPTIIRPMTDLEVAQVQIVENLQREDVSALDEARAYAALRDQHGQTSTQIAAAIGTSTRHVLARISLTKLTGAALEALRDGRIGAEIGVLISALPPTLHDRAAKLVRVQDEDGTYRTVSLRVAREVLRTKKLVMPIMSAPFDILAPRLIDCAGACTDCQSNTNNLDDQAQSDLGADICTDPTCYAAKLAAHTQRELGNLADNGWTVLDEEPEFGSWHPLTGDYRDNTAKAIGMDPDMRAHCVAWPDHVTGLHATGVARAGYTAMLRLIYPAPPPAAPRTTPEGGGGDAEEEETTVATKRDTSDQEPTTLAPKGAMWARDMLSLRVVEAVLRGDGWPPNRLDMNLVCAALANNASDEALAITGLPAHRVGLGAMLDEITSWPDNRVALTVTALAIAAMASDLSNDRAVVLLSQLHTRYLGGEGDKASHGSAVESQEDQPSPRAGDEVSDEAPLAGREVMDDAGASARPTDTVEAPPAPRHRKTPSARYRCPSTGQTWTGRGLKPRWLVQALEDGKSLEDFDTKPQGETA